MTIRSEMCSHHAEVVADEQAGQPEVAAQLHEQVEHLRLDRDVERRDGFVADQEFGLDRERARDADAGALPAGELVRIARLRSRDRARRGAASRRHSRRARACGTMPCTTGASPTMSMTRMRGLSEAIGSWKIIWMLERALARACAATSSLDVRAAVSRCSPALGGMMPAIDAAERGLAAAGLADQADHLALLDRRDRRRRPRARRSRACRRRTGWRRAPRVERLDEVLADARERRASARSCRRPALDVRMPAARGRCPRHAPPCAGSRGAGRIGARAARREGAARRQVRERRRHAGDLRERRAAPVAARHRSDQPAGVGMERPREHARRPAPARRCGPHTSRRCGRRARRRPRDRG